jgi:hypothetical protein
MPEISDVDKSIDRLHAKRGEIGRDWVASLPSRPILHNTVMELSRFYLSNCLRPHSLTLAHVSTNGDYSPRGGNSRQLPNIVAGAVVGDGSLRKTEAQKINRSGRPPNLYCAICHASGSAAASGRRDPPTRPTRRPPRETARARCPTEVEPAAQHEHVRLSGDTITPPPRLRASRQHSDDHHECTPHRQAIDANAASYSSADAAQREDPHCVGLCEIGRHQSQ